MIADDHTGEGTSGRKSNTGDSKGFPHPRSQHEDTLVWEFCVICGPQLGHIVLYMGHNQKTFLFNKHEHKGNKSMFSLSKVLKSRKDKKFSFCKKESEMKGQIKVSKFLKALDIIRDDEVLNFSSRKEHLEISQELFCPDIYSSNTN